MHPRSITHMKLLNKTEKLSSKYCKFYTKLSILILYFKHLEQHKFRMKFRFEIQKKQLHIYKPRINLPIVLPTFYIQRDIRLNHNLVALIICSAYSALYKRVSPTVFLLWSYSLLLHYNIVLQICNKHFTKPPKSN